MSKPIDVLWFIPNHGDGRYLGTAEGARPLNLAYITQVAQAVEHLGYHGALLPTGRTCEDAWIAASMLAARTQRMRFLVAVRPGLVSPTLAARMAATFDRLSGGRLLINVVTGGDVDELHGDGIFLSPEERYAQTAEFLTIWDGLARGRSVDFKGEHLHVEEAQLLFPAQQERIPLYFGGSSPPALRVAAQHVDVYLTWGEPPAAVGEKIRALRALAAEHGRNLRFGIRLHVIVRETVEEARNAAERLISRVSEDLVAAARSILSRHESEGQRRMLELNKEGGEKLWIRPDLWSGPGLVRGGAGTAMVGDGPTVAALMQEYIDLGIDTFVLSGYPHLEEAYHFAEHVFPHIRLRAEGESHEVAALTGEFIANRAVPVLRRN